MLSYNLASDKIQELHMNKYPQLHANNGPFISSVGFSDSDRTETEVYFHHKEKSEVMMTAASSWYGGDFMEFGSHDLNTFRDFLTAYNICGMTRAYSDVKFYAFDIFGKLEEDIGDLALYFKPYSDQGDRLEHHKNLVRQHGLYVGKCQLIQGLFKNTLTEEFKEKWRTDKIVGVDYSETALHLSPEHRNPKERQIGFASLDCNIESSYKIVFEWIFDVMAENSYIYMDEGLQNPDVLAQWLQFRKALSTERNMGSVYIRNAGGFGSLWRLYPIVEGTLDL